MTFADNLKTLRNDRSLSQKELAQALWFSFQNISKWERNESLPDVETLLSIAKFFGTTTDALLGYKPEETTANLRIDEEEVTIYHTYPAEEVNVSDRLVFAIDDGGKIVAIVSYPIRCLGRLIYTRRGYDPYEENVTLIHKFEQWNSEKMQWVVNSKGLKIPAGGFVFAVSYSAFAVKNIVQFIIPEEYLRYLAPELHDKYYIKECGKSLFSDILKQNELDYVTVESVEGGLLFRKTVDTVDPLTVNVETLTKLVRKEVEKEHDRQIEALNSKSRELSDMTADLESRICDLENSFEELQNHENE